jgi:hypothetical protein
MFEHLAKYRKIVVTGPQRSGTTICARMVAADTGHEYVDEDRFGVSQEGPFWDLVKSPALQVIQAPGMAHICHKMTDEDVFVIFMTRDLAEILRSQKRIEWSGEEVERKKYGMTPNDDRPIASVKLSYWLNEQRTQLGKKGMIVEYYTLGGHWMWIEPKYRTDFGPRQWRMA